MQTPTRLFLALAAFSGIAMAQAELRTFTNSQGKTVQATKKDVTALEEKPKTVTVEPGVSVGKLAEMLNGMGVSPRDMVAILQAIKEAGALQAELRVL